MSYWQFQEVASIPNKKGKIPLHFAAREGRTEMVRFLLSANPNTAAIPSKKNKLALHFAAGEGHQTIVELLLNTYPEGSLQRSSKGKLPLHFAARWGHLQVAKTLLTLFPDAVRGVDLEGSLPLHDAAREGQVDMARYLFRIYPRGLMTANIRNEIPLFPAVRSGNLDLVIPLIQAWPTGGKFVLKHACVDDNVHHWSSDILELLLRGAVGNFHNCALLEGRQAPALVCGDSVVHPAGADDSDEISDTPNESGSRKRPAVSSAHNRPEKRIRSRRMPDEFLPLHSALACGANAHVLGHVLDKYSEQVMRPDANGRLPLHVAMKYVRGQDKISVVLNKILRPHPEAALVKDEHGLLPLHVALCHKAEFGLVQPLLDLNPSSGFTPHGLPLQMAMAHDCDLSTVYSLLRGDPCALCNLVRKN
jgi:ankyrin repeat protein